MGCADGNGNVVVLIDNTASANPQAQYTYDAYGRLMASGGPLASANVYQFSSKEFQANSGFYYYGYRLYSPYLQKWVNRDPIDEQGFHTVRLVSIRSTTEDEFRWIFQRMAQGRLIAIDIAAVTSGYNPFTFSKNDAINDVDVLGPQAHDCTHNGPCTSAPGLPDNSPACDSYGNEIYPGLGVSLKCFCKCAGNSAWSQKVRGCLAREHDKGTDVTIADLKCYAAAGADAPYGTLAKCYVECGGVLPGPPPQYPGHGLP